MDDLWLEHASGSFVLNLVPNKDSPQFNLRLSGAKAATDSGSSGMIVRLKIEGLKLAGEPGKD